MQTAERFTASVEEWTCPCGRQNAAGLSMCPHCGRVPPRGVRTINMAGPVPGRPLAPPPRVRGIRLAVGVILLNILVQGVTIGLVQAGRMERSKAIALGLWLGVAFYGVVLAIIIGPLLTLRPNWLRGDPRTARLLGAEVGFAAALGVIALSWAATGHPVLDPGAEVLVSEGSFLRVVVALAVIAVVAPVVEELLFRGVVAESLRRHGAVLAVGVSALLFALAHLRWSWEGVTYYGVCGVVLGVLYLRRGLWASVAAHAVFNGSLVLLAVVVAHGPTHLLASNGVSFRAPSDWRLAEPAEAPGATLALRGPSGATLVVSHRQVPGRLPSPDQVASALNSGQLPLPPESAIEGVARVTRYPAGAAVEVKMKVRGQGGVVVVIPRSGELWEVDIATAGSDRATREYPGLLQSLVLPSSAGGL